MSNTETASGAHVPCIDLLCSPLNDSVPQLVSWYWENGKLYRQVWNCETEQYNQSVEINPQNAARLLTQYETRIAQHQLRCDVCGRHEAPPSDAGEPCPLCEQGRLYPQTHNAQHDAGGRSGADDDSRDKLIAAFSDISRTARITAQRIAPLWKQFYSSLPPALKAELDKDANVQLDGQEKQT